MLTPLFRRELIAAQPLAEVPTWTYGADAVAFHEDFNAVRVNRQAMLDLLRQLGYVDG